MSLVIFGSGPLPCEPRFPVMAPGSRTWQIVQTAVRALAKVGRRSRVVVFGLEPAPRGEGEPEEFSFQVPVPAEEAPWEVTYRPCGYEQFVAVAGAEPGTAGLPEQIEAVVGCASAQPCATAAEFASSRRLPLWIDLFGDPIAEVQSKAELHGDQREANDQLTMHVWRLLMRALLQADRFSALSERQRHAVIGQLGAAGRLSRRTRSEDLVSAIPYGLFPSDLPEPDVTAVSQEQSDTFTVMWCGSFNTWMDVDSLIAGVTQALREEPRLRLLVVGGKIPNYNEETYDRFVAGMRDGGVGEAVEFTDWCSLEETRRLYARCDAGLSIDRYTYEAVLGSRTRILNFLAAGKPVLSTVIAEVTEELARAGCLLPFRANDANDLARALVEAVRLGREGAREIGARGRDFVMDTYGGEKVGRPFAEWIVQPRFSGDRNEAGEFFSDNPLIEFWRRVGAAG